LRSQSQVFNIWQDIDQKFYAEHTPNPSLRERMRKTCTNLSNIHDFNILYQSMLLRVDSADFRCPTEIWSSNLYKCTYWTLTVIGPHEFEFYLRLWRLLKIYALTFWVTRLIYFHGKTRNFFKQNLDSNLSTNDGGCCAFTAH